MANCRIIIENYQNNINKKTTFFPSLEEWRMSPIILFDKQSVLNPKRIKLEGAGKLLNLICTASILTRSTYFSVYVFILIFVLENLIIDNNICKNLLCMCIPSKNLSLIINVHVIYPYRYLVIFHLAKEQWTRTLLGLGLPLRDTI